MIELPPLPYGASQPYGYTEAEMRAYGEACFRAGVESVNRHEQTITDLAHTPPETKSPRG
jgi:hypothetical protein